MTFFLSIVTAIARCAVYQDLPGWLSGKVFRRHLPVVLTETGAARLGRFLRMVALHQDIALLAIVVVIIDTFYR